MSNGKNSGLATLSGCFNIRNYFSTGLLKQKPIATEKQITQKDLIINQNVTGTNGPKENQTLSNNPTLQGTNGPMGNKILSNNPTLQGTNGPMGNKILSNNPTLQGTNGPKAQQWLNDSNNAKLQGSIGDHVYEPFTTCVQRNFANFWRK